MHHHKLNQAITPLTATLLKVVYLNRSSKPLVPGIDLDSASFLCILLPERGRCGCMKPSSAVEQVTQGGVPSLYGLISETHLPVSL